MSARPPIAGTKGGESTFVGGDSIGISGVTARSRIRPGTSWPGCWGPGRPGRGGREGRQRRLAHRPRRQPVQQSRSAARDVQHDRGQGPDAVRPELQPDVQRPPGPVARSSSATRCSAMRARSTPTTTRSPLRFSHSRTRRGRPEPVPPARTPTSRRNRGGQGYAVAGRNRDNADAGLATHAASNRNALRPADGHLRGRLLRRPAAARRPDVGRQLAAAGRRQGPELPQELHRDRDNTLFGPAVVFTIEYTVIVTVLLIGLGLGLALLVQESGRWAGFLRTCFLLPGALGLASASLLFWGFYSPTIGPVSPPLEKVGLINEPIQFLGDVAQRAAFDDVPDRLEVRRVLHADPARRPAGHPGRGVRGRRDRRRDALADASATSRCRCCGRRSPWR